MNDDGLLAALAEYFGMTSVEALLIMYRHLDQPILKGLKQ